MDPFAQPALAALLGSDDRAAELARHFGGVGFALLASPDELAASGLSADEVARISASRLLANLLIAPTPPARLRDPPDVARALSNLALLQHEELWVAAVDSDLRPLTIAAVAKGSANTCRATPGCVLAPVLRVRASRFFLAHNHPSGNATPSPDDHAFTDRIRKAAAVVGLELLDHLVITRDRWTSCLTGASAPLALRSVSSALDLERHRHPPLATGERRHIDSRKRRLHTRLKGRIAARFGAHPDLGELARRHRERDLGATKAGRLQGGLAGASIKALPGAADHPREVGL